MLCRNRNEKQIQYAFRRRKRRANQENKHRKRKKLKKENEEGCQDRIGYKSKSQEIRDLIIARKTHFQDRNTQIAQDENGRLLHTTHSEPTF